MVKSVTPAGRRARFRAAGGGRRWGGWALLLGLGVPFALGGGWVAAHRVPGVAPWAADTLRSIVGVEGVARLEDQLYAIEDRVNRLLHWGNRPQPRWEVPERAPSPALLPGAAGVEPPATEPAAGERVAAEPAALEPALSPSSAVSATAEKIPAKVARANAAPLPPVPVFRPPDIGPVHESWSAPGDGQWLSLGEPSQGREPVMFKTLLHPDKKRSWAELFVVAIDLDRIQLHLVPGTRQPRATVLEGMKLERSGYVPREHHSSVLAAFNGGFKTEHGHYGMGVGGITLVRPHQASCTVLSHPETGLQIGSWERMGGLLEGSHWWRQTPNCMFEDGQMHPRLAQGYAHKWGATLSGQTVIRRSAIGIDAGARTLYVGISNHTTAPAIAHGMRHAGAATVAQLDVNHSYPKFVTYSGSRISKLRFAQPLAGGFRYSEHEYLRKPSRRDFFYVMPAPARVKTASNGH